MRPPYQRFAVILDYPGPSLPAELAACLAVLGREQPRAAGPLQAFAGAVSRLGLAGLQEAYTAAFDLSSGCALEIGHQLLGESWKRTAFLLQLRRLFREVGFVEDGELPDHLCTLLRFLAVHPDRPESDELARTCLLPALAKLRRALEARSSPYQAAVASLADALGAAAQEVAG